MATSAQNSLSDSDKLPKIGGEGTATHASSAGDAMTDSGSRKSTSQTSKTLVVQPGHRIRDYELLELLGQGGMGSVWKAKHTRLKKFVAVKLLPQEKTSDEAAVARFNREMEAVGALRHPHIIEAHDAGEEAGTHYLVMEFVEGIELAALSKKIGPLPITDACELMRQTALGLQHAFEHGLVHRDIKPSNLLLATDESQSSRSRETSVPDPRTLTSSATTCTLKILDLGLALLQGDVATGSDLTSTGQVMGTLDYIAPEQLADTHAVDIRADLYSLGCTLYRLLTGEPPFSSATLNTAAKKIFAHSFTPPPSLLSRRPDAPPELSALVNRLLAKKPEERFATPHEVAAALAPFCAGHDLVSLLARSTSPSFAPDPFASTVIPVADGEAHASRSRNREISDKSPPNSIDDGSLTTSATKTKRRPLIALACVASLVLAGIIFKFTTDSGEPEAVRPRTAPKSTDVRGLTPPGSPSSKSEISNSQSQIPADPDRAAAEWVLAQKTAMTAVVGIQLIAQPVSAKKVQRGEPLPDEQFHVAEIGLAKADITDRDLAHYLPPLTRITRLDVLHCTGITDASVLTLREIGGLSFLDVAGTSLSPPACMELMQTLPLENIGLSGRFLTPELIDLICVTPRIKQVAVVASASKPEVGTVTDEQLKSLFRAKQLFRLGFIDVTADKATWHELPDSLPNLTHLHVEGKHFTDAHLTEFARLAKLNRLGLLRTAITDAGLPALYDSRALRTLDLSGTAVTTEAVRALHDHIPLCRITHPGGVIEPKAAPTRIGSRETSVPDRSLTTSATKTTKSDQDREVAEWVLSVGGSLKVVQDGVTISLAPGAKLPDSPFVIDGVDISSLYSKAKDKVIVIDDELARFAGLTELRELLINSNSVTDRGVAQLRDLPKLRLLHLEGTKVTDACVDSILAVPSLEYLHLSRTKVTPGILPKLKSLPKLRGLSAYDWAFTPTTATSLLEIPSLREFSLHESWLSDAGITTLRQMLLYALFIEIDGRLSDERLQLLAALPQLERFGVQVKPSSKSYPYITPSGFRTLADLPRLTTFVATNFRFTDEHLAAIAEIKGLEQFKVFHYDTTSSPLTDTGLEYLSRLPKLKQLTLMKTQVTPAGLARFRAAKPDCQITTDVKSP